MASYTSTHHQVSCLQSAESVRRYGRRKSLKISVKSPIDLHSLRSRRGSCLSQYSRLWLLLWWQVSNLGKSWRYWRTFVAAALEWLLGAPNSSKHQPQVVSSSVRGDVQAELPAAWATAHGLPFGECTPAWCSVLPVCAAVWCGFQWSSVASPDSRTPLCCPPHTHWSCKPIASCANYTGSRIQWSIPFMVIHYFIGCWASWQSWSIGGGFLYSFVSLLPQRSHWQYPLNEWVITLLLACPYIYLGRERISRSQTRFGLVRL